MVIFVISCIIGSAVLSPIWGPIYINNVLGTIANRHVIDELGNVCKINNRGEEKKIRIETSFEEKVSESGSAPWLMLAGGIPYALEPIKATFYMVEHLIKKGFDRND